MRLLFLLILIILFSACKPGSRDLDMVVVRIADDPDGLNPVVSRSSISVPILSRIFSGLYSYDPVHLALVPVLADSIREPRLEVSADGDSLYVLRIEILDEAVWEDGNPVTVDDYLFSLKCFLLSEIYGSIAPMFLVPGMLHSFEKDTNDIRSFDLIFKQDQLQFIETFTTIFILPRHIYDPKSVTDKISDEMVVSASAFKRLYERSAELQAFTEEFNSTLYARELITGSGPYRFDKWETGQFVRLEKKTNYWGAVYQDKRPDLTAFPDQLIYRIIPDDQAALAALKNGRLDVLGELSPDIFKNFTQDTLLSRDYRIYTPSVLQYFFICLNNNSPGLDDKNVRRALAHLIDLNEIINELFDGLASPIAGPIHPMKSYYNMKLKSIQYNPEIASGLLSESGWVDLNGDGILDKVKSKGDTMSLQYKLITSQRQLGQDLALIFRQNAAKVGIEIEIVVMDNTNLISSLVQSDFDMANLAGRFSPGKDDLRYTWHTESAGGVGNNFMGYGRAETDSLIDLIGKTSDPVALDLLFQTFQQIVYDDQPVLFLCTPNERIITPSSIELITSYIKPGYCENLIRPSSK